MQEFFTKRLFVPKVSSTNIDVFMLLFSSDDSDSANQRPRSRSVQDSPQFSPMRTLGAEYDLETQGSTQENRHSKNHGRFVTASSASAPMKRPLGGFSVLRSFLFNNIGWRLDVI